MQRNNSGVSYPYTIQNALSITGSDQGSNLFYYFFDWQVDVAPTSCPSVRLPVTVNVNSTVGISETSGRDLNVYPNPAKDKLYIETATPFEATLMMYDQAGRMLINEMMNTEKYGIDISHLEAGIYNLKVQNNEQQYIYKIIVQ